MKDYPYTQEDNTPAIDAEANEWGASQQELVDYYMRLPPGEMCINCVNFKKCVSLIHCAANSTVCDWYPSRFRQIKRS